MKRFFEASAGGPGLSCSRRRLLLLSLAAAATGTAMSLPVLAQTPGAAATPAAAPPEKKSFSPAELDQILAPIALYDDALLSQVLMAATYPLEIVEAARWQQANPGPKGDAAVAAVADKTWDVSVKSLVAFPSILKQMSERLDWTQKLGDALLGQQADVAASIQRLRAKAAAAGTLKTGAGPQYTVSAETQGSETVYAIAQSSPEVVYVPSYDPNTAYGAWSEPAYPPTTWPMGGALMSGLMWGVGIAAVGALYGGWRWGYGGGGGWGNSYTTVNASRAVNIDRNFNRNNIGSGDRWQHQVDHRRGVAYRDPATRQQFGQNRPGAEQREQFRGQVQRPAQGPAGGPGANRPGPGTGGPGGGCGPASRCGRGRSAAPGPAARRRCGPGSGRGPASRRRRRCARRRKSRRTGQSPIPARPSATATQRRRRRSPRRRWRRSAAAEAGAAVRGEEAVAEVSVAVAVAAADSGGGGGGGGGRR